jgi:hypothetical protein
VISLFNAPKRQKSNLIWSMSAMKGHNAEITIRDTKHGWYSLVGLNIPSAVCQRRQTSVEMWWHTVTHGWWKWRGSWRMEWVARTLHTTSEHGVSSITTADAHTSAASSRLNWRPRRFK